MVEVGILVGRTLVDHTNRQISKEDPSQNMLEIEISQSTLDVAELSLEECSGIVTFDIFAFRHLSL